MSIIYLDLSTKLRRIFWAFWEKRKKELSLPEELSKLTPEQAYRRGHCQGYWEGSTDAVEISSSLPQDEEEGEGETLSVN